ncbi:MAG TPA: asparagine synthase (glutamine-hydrolyzing) [Gemmatimonadaceae bacterium]|nr:asparagine synthase (glutamine-hydrolyzing) [Gemmatimonadaceae bacterium]
MSSGLKRPFHHRLLKSLRRRGPDEIGFWSDERVQMAHARLSIIGLDERGTEPLENDTHVLIYNGEIYNFNLLADRLRAQGIRIRGSNDAEVLLQAWSVWGPAVLTELDGFWAFVIYDKSRRTLTLVRDQFGVKPLYYWKSGDAICISSMIRTILENAPVERSLDYAALSEYARYQFTFGDKTFIQGVRKVLPGHIVEIDLTSGSLTPRRYEDILAAPAAREQVTPRWIDETRELLRECVLASTISDTSFTTFCSGGLDSSLITRIAEPEIAYHCNYSDPDCNETFFAQQVVAGRAERLFVVNAREEFDLVDRLSDIVRDFDELTIGSVILPLDDLLAQVKRRYKVILTGTGGDELFAGYVRYQLVLGECYQDSYRGLFSRMQGLESPTERFELTHRKGEPHLYKFYDSGVESTFHEAFAECTQSGSPLEAMLRFDRRYFLAGLLNIDDKMSGRHSLESRPSFLHQRLVRRVNTVDGGALLCDGQLKPILRSIGAEILPKSVLHRTDKMGFTTPIGTFVNNSAGTIREQITNSKFRDFYDLKKLNLTAETKFSREVFGLLMLDVWLNEYATA